MRQTPTFAYRSFWPQQEVVTQFADRGVDVVCIYPANTLNSLGLPYSKHPANWLHLGVYDWAALDVQFDEIIAANAKVRFLCMIDLNTPLWQERFSYIHDTFRHLGQTAASAIWRQQAGDYLDAFLRHVEAKYGPRMEGYILSCGCTCEWQDWARGENSPSRREAWRAWCKERGHEDPIDIPDKSRRDAAAHGLLRDPVTDAVAIRYWDFNRWLIADAILHFAAKAQTVLAHRVQLGVFFGYILEHGQGRLVSEGCLGFDSVFASPDLDFFVAPATYGDRAMGGASGFMAPLESIKLHGKGLLQELDHFTSTANGNPLAQYGIEWGQWNHRWTDEASSIAGLKREFSLALVEGVSLWWFDMWNHWYEGEKVLAAIAGMKRIWDGERAVGGAAPVSEIAVLVDAESCLYINEDHGQVNDLLYTLRQSLGRLGAPFSLYSFADLDAIDFSRFKLVILPNLFVCDAARAQRLRSRLLRDGRTILWIHQAGVIADGRHDQANVERLTGLGYAPGVVARKEHGTWTSVLHADTKPSLAFLRTTAEAAGVHCYGEPGEPVFVNTRLLASHSATGGVRRFRLPQRARTVTELFSGRVVATDCTTFEDRLDGPGSVPLPLRLTAMRLPWLNGGDGGSRRR